VVLKKLLPVLSRAKVVIFLDKNKKNHIFYIIKHKKPSIFEKYPEIILYSRIK